MASLLVCLGCHNNITNWVAYTTETYHLSQLRRLEGLNQGASMIGFWRGLFSRLADSCPLPAPSHGSERDREHACVVSSYKGLPPIMKASLWRPHLNQTTSQSPISKHHRFGVSTFEFWGGHKHSVYNRISLFLFVFIYESFMCFFLCLLYLFFHWLLSLLP